MGFLQALHLFENGTRETVPQHLYAKLGIRRLNGNIDRLHTVFDDPIDVVVGHICQSDVIALQKGKPGVIVFKIERLPHSLWKLVYKAENAFVAAGTVIVHKTAFK